MTPAPICSNVRSLVSGTEAATRTKERKYFRGAYLLQKESKDHAPTASTATVSSTRLRMAQSSSAWGCLKSITVKSHKIRWLFPTLLSTLNRLKKQKMRKSRPQPPGPDRRRQIRGSFSWIDHRLLREGFDQVLTRLEKQLEQRYQPSPRTVNHCLQAVRCCYRSTPDKRHRLNKRLFAIASQQ